ncbi:MAG: energy-coupling factor ABC transporter permease [Synergistaceae bacterium]|jgi:cobalt/nickel transport system permease protein|nr:energy-coupling factor ABC transporter permease [Synergistaceae bacterium]
MHMADALLSPAVGGAMTAVSVAAIGYAVKKISRDGLDEKKIPLMGVMGAFVFAGQMINFTIPGTGSSGHIGGGILLAALLGPFPALIALASVLLIQCLLFADGGLLAYGCNVFNMGVCSCLLAYRYVYKPIAGKGFSAKSIFWASVMSVILGLQVGAFGVVAETYLSGVTELPFRAFLLLMQPIHLAIGLVEGLVTAAVLTFVYNARPELLTSTVQETALAKNISTRKVAAALLVSTALVGGGLSLFASAYPDGLEWSMEGVAGTAELERDDPVHKTMSGVVEATAVMPDYSFAGSEEGSSLGTATAGIAGSVVTLMLAGGLGLAVGAARRK